MTAPAPIRRATALVLALAASVTLAACGIGAGAPTTDTRLTVTRDFGQQLLERVDETEAPGTDTAMRLLQRHADVETRYGGGFVQSINGLAGGEEDGRRVDWLYFVNGVMGEEGAAAYELKEGDHVWWDFHDWGVTSLVPAVVGAYPEPFVHGIEGRRLPVRVECPVPEGAACESVRDRLVQLGIVPGTGGLRSSLAKETIRVVVGPWEAVRADEVVRRLEKGPQESGVYARVAPDGRSIEVLDPRGRVTRTLGPGTGLVAATRIEGEAPVWIVTGTDEAGLRAATNALSESRLDRAYALAVTPSGDLPLPEVDAAPAERDEGATATP